jgi:hypothetical protein
LVSITPALRDIHKNLSDVSVRCGVGNIVQFGEKDMAPSRGKLESVGGEERHLDRAWKAAWRMENGKEIGLEWQWKLIQDKVRVGL